MRDQLEHDPLIDNLPPFHGTVPGRFVSSFSRIADSFFALGPNAFARSALSQITFAALTLVIHFAEPLAANDGQKPIQPLETHLEKDATSQPAPQSAPVITDEDRNFWAFRNLSRVQPPKIDGHISSPIDQFILSRLASSGLTYAAPVDRATLCRRLYLDLIGLPPTPAEVDRFAKDTSPDAVELLVNQLLASPHYGERWGRQWLDVVGYADSNGYIRHDSPRPLAFHYRDYVIQSLNEDKPYDQFWVEQLAGDELVNYAARQHLTPTELKALRATHYLRNAPDGTDNTEGNETTRTIERYAVLEAQLQTTMSAMFGMTVDCARCHDHKFDPIPQRDYYALQSIFYPAFNVKEWVQPKDRWIYAAGQADLTAWKESNQRADREIAALKETHRQWIVAHRPAGLILWSDDFSGDKLAKSWSPTAPADTFAKPVPLTTLDQDIAPAAKITSGRLSLIAAAPGDSRWLSTLQKFDWTPEAIGQWIQVTFDIAESQGPNGQPAERIGYYIALHDYDDNSEASGGNILLDGNPAGGAGVHLDYPGRDQKGLGSIGTAGYVTGRNYGVRISRTGRNEFLLEHLVDGVPESGSLKLTAEQLPDGAFGFELCCSRSFTVDNVVIEQSINESKKADESQTPAQSELTRQLEEREQKLTSDIAAVNSTRLPEPVRIAWATDLKQAPPDVPLLKRGDYFQPGELVQPGMLSVLMEPGQTIEFPAPPSGAKTTGRRLTFARWATAPNSRAGALLARVQVDRIWRAHFGQGLVPTPDNFGVSGVEPTHPELLEWLAALLIDQGWSQKAVHREIVLSQAYLQSSAVSAPALEKDPTNELYSRFPTHRLEAEQIRDSMLAVAGVLNRSQGGPAVETIDLGNRQIVLPEPTGPGPHDVDRRSIYIRYRRSQPLSFLRTFDQAAPEPNCIVRGTSTVVGQSLALLNGSFARRMGRAFSQRLGTEFQVKSDQNFVQQAFQVAYSRAASPEELQRSVEFLVKQTDRRLPTLNEGAQLEARADFCRMLLATNEFLYLP